MRFQSENTVFKILRRSVNGKHLMRFQSETSVFKFLRRNVEGAFTACVFTHDKQVRIVFTIRAPYIDLNLQLKSSFSLV